MYRLALFVGASKLFDFLQYDFINMLTYTVEIH